MSTTVALKINITECYTEQHSCNRKQNSKTDLTLLNTPIMHDSGQQLHQSMPNQLIMFNSCQGSKQAGTSFAVMLNS